MGQEMFLSLALLFLTSGALTNAQSEGEARGFAELEPAVVYYDINRNITLNCTFPNADKTLTYLWKKNDKAINEVPELKERFKLEENNAVFSVKGRANEDDYGNYSCALGGEARAWELRGRPVARLPDNTNVVEGQKLKLQCKVVGKPYPRVTWTYRLTEESNETVPLGEAEGGEGGEAARWRLEPNEQGVEGAALVLEAAARADAGVYECRAGAGAPDHTVLRVKDMYAALWPFLGICAEVFVLCAIILVYEKRRTKPELDDSDTDNHDQKKS
ncbi:basigin [Ostrinia furnacalis]|uniref:basigin n=1 Tax=Ostrinia furnacalis TaxID=93504 RepID=UPI00103BB3F9|nr:basigin [Ostrinia furnacalis]